MLQQTVLCMVVKLSFHLAIAIMIQVQKHIILNFLLLLVRKVTSATYYVIPDDYSSHHTDPNTFSLQHYLNNTSEYFVSHNQFHFMQGQHYVDRDLIIEDVDNFTITGPTIGQCSIICTSPASIVVLNATTIKFLNISLVNCIRNHKDYINTLLMLSDYHYKLYERHSVPFSKVTDYYTSAFISNSSFVIIYNMNINATVNTSFTAFLIVNGKDSSLVNVKVQVTAHAVLCANFSSHPKEINGLKLFVYFYNISESGSLTIDNFYYTTNKTCANHLFCAIVTFFLHDYYRPNTYTKNKFTLNILNTVFSYLKSSSVLCIYGEIMRDSSETSSRNVIIKRSTFFNNFGNPKLNMFNIVFICLGTSCFYINPASSKESYMVRFHECTFTRNTNMQALIYVKPSNAAETLVYIPILKSIFSDNKNTTLIKVARKFQIVYSSTIIEIILAFVNMSLNEYHYGKSLISITKGRLRIHSVIFDHNCQYDNLIDLQSSMLLFKKKYSEISNNCVRHIIKAQRSSYVFIDQFITVNISNNVVYKVIKQVRTSEEHTAPLCPLHVYHFVITQTRMNLKSINCTLLISNNTEMISKVLPTEIISYVNDKCTWFEGTIFQQINATVNVVYDKMIIRINNTFVNKTTKRLVPLSVCPCLNNNSYNCYKADVYAVYPGQLLHVNLLVSPTWYKLSSTIIAANTKDDDCSILDSYQLSQICNNNGCNRYSYTIWPNSEFIAECKLFIGLSAMPEMFYVEIKPCPMGFTLQSDKKACYCDPLLRNDKVSITSCDINDKTIQRPANSWISAVTVNNSHSYNVSSQCPFDYCLPYSSHLNLSNPDSQCQFKRSGVVCAECQQGLSAVFGSSHCKQCSNFYLLLIIPMAIAGIVLVMMLFTFNLTVTNGIINTLIFYVNIISVNYSQFCFYSNSPDCTILSLLNLDLGIETCFYDGMDGYTKMWLQLVFPCYFMIIAFTLIIGSRHSSKLQRLTANRVLKVLATLFLLSYTKILLTVCQVLFFFSSVTHLPSKHTILFWSVDTGVELFGIKFCILYTVCLVVFLILVIFNTLLLFPKTVSRWNFINYFKPLLDAYFGPYKQKYPFWIGLQLSIRSCFFGLSALDRSVSLFSGTVLAAVVLYVHCIVYPFKSRSKNFQESLVLLDLSAVYVTALYNEYESSTYKLFIIRLLIVTVLAYFIVLIFCHCIMLLYGDAIKRRVYNIKHYKQMLMKRIKRKQTHSGSLQLEQLSSKIPDVAFNYSEFREPLVALD